MNYAETIDYLYNKLPMFSTMGCTAFKKDLTNTLILCERLGNPHNKFKSIHVAGTNGKGSVSHMLAAILQQSGYKTGLYTSPHLKDFRERIRINGDWVDEDFVIQFVEKVKPLIEKIQPSFFEITVAMAFAYFAEQQVDIAVVEVGLGGRLDSTNVITPELAVITNIGMDHTNMLGNTLEEIAAEKGGIIKEKVPVVIGEKHPATAPVFTSLSSGKNAPVSFANDQFILNEYNFSHQFLEIQVQERQSGTIHKYVLDLPGIYQTKNILTVLQATDILRKIGWNIEDQDVFEALQHVKSLTGLSGRWEIIKENPTVVLEVAHNEDGIRQMVDHLGKLNFGNLHMVLGIVKDKDVTTMLNLLPQKANYYFTNAHIPRALEAKHLQEQAKLAGLKGITFDNVNEALKTAIANASPDDLVIVCGSIFLVAEIEKDEV
ncbi:bifunctional folylpolyglutamate synthase/dihydrofolate synthase [Chitinophagaceae bacterium LB-8]|uniref:Dihydrofolate synthase/folylpolyglutamate synthase n=1 Tax=Paraflavisolibacter caeni TaxID=2982496 RepID=A0A9X2Y0I5_9BACT|nr:bifunctional folylpolyglutamate synthase/dihydrofolate synthase [Paraflavisolibacter caeni]MCU7552137.1 bifunctional folylpolyglutamate synthase/dihydrofolate synthase [Paraflavisolibacter caeni]